MPADGKYPAHGRQPSGDNLFGPRHIYRVRITHEQPDFRLVALSSAGLVPAVTARVPPGGSAAYHRVRSSAHDGFNGDIDADRRGAAAGRDLPAAGPRPRLRETTLVLSAAADAAEWAGEIKIKGTATINGQKVVREARAGGIVWPVQPSQNIADRQPARASPVLAVRGKAPFTLTPSSTRRRSPQGDKATIGEAQPRSGRTSRGRSRSA